MIAGFQKKIQFHLAWNKNSWFWKIFVKTKVEFFHVSLQCCHEICFLFECQEDMFDLWKFSINISILKILALFNCPIFHAKIHYIHGICSMCIYVLVKSNLAEYALTIFEIDWKLLCVHPGQKTWNCIEQHVNNMTNIIFSIFRHLQPH